LEGAIVNRSRFVRVLIVALGFSVCSTLNAQSPTKDEQQALAALNALIASYAAKDGAAAARVYHDNLSYGHSFGQIDTKEYAIKDLENGMNVSAKLVDADVKVTGQTAIIRSTMNYAADCSQPKTTCGVRVLWVMVKDKGSWQVLARQAVASFNNPTVLCCAHAAAEKAKQK
jgi:hypothetical protein